MSRGKREEARKRRAALAVVGAIQGTPAKQIAASIAEGVVRHAPLADCANPLLAAELLPSRDEAPSVGAVAARAASPRMPPKRDRIAPAAPAARAPEMGTDQRQAQYMAAYCECRAASGVTAAYEAGGQPTQEQLDSFHAMMEARGLDPLHGPNGEMPHGYECKQAISPPGLGAVDVEDQQVFNGLMQRWSRLINWGVLDKVDGIQGNFSNWKAFQTDWLANDPRPSELPFQDIALNQVEYLARAKGFSPPGTKLNAPTQLKMDPPEVTVGPALPPAPAAPPPPAPRPQAPRKAPAAPIGLPAGAPSATVAVTPEAIDKLVGPNAAEEAGKLFAASPAAALAAAIQQGSPSAPAAPAAPPPLLPGLPTPAQMQQAAVDAAARIEQATRPLAQQAAQQAQQAQQSLPKPRPASSATSPANVIASMPAIPAARASSGPSKTTVWIVIAAAGAGLLALFRKKIPSMSASAPKTKRSPTNSSRGQR